MDDFPILSNINFESDPALLVTLLLSVLMILFLWLIRSGILKLVSRRTDDLTSRYNWRKITDYVFFFLAAALITPLWIGSTSGLTTYLGLVTAGVAIALREPLTNLGGWFFILWRRPFRIGNRIQIGENAGDVVDIRIFQFSLMEIGNWVDADQSTGRIVHVPNGAVFSSPLANYSHGFNFIWNEIPVNITFESDWKKARSLLQGIAEKYSSNPEQSEKPKTGQDEEYLIFYQHLSPTVYTEVTDRGVELTIRYLCEPQQRRATSHLIWEDVLTAFSAEKAIRFAHPTYRYLGEKELPWQQTPD